MNLNNSNLQQLVLIVGLLFFFSCKSDEEKTVINSDQPKAVQKLFPFYKNLELKPGYNFEVLSWGKGPDSVGAYQILMSDSARNSYKSISSERKGIITDAWNMDLDNDGNAEIYIELTHKNKSIDLNVFEFSNAGFNKINFPSLSASNKKKYIGNDKFFVKEGSLFRSFSIKAEKDSTKTETQTLEYKLRGNSFSTLEEKPNL